MHTDSEHRFLIAEIHALDKAKWLASEIAHRDLTDDNNFYVEWINCNGALFRAAWCNSRCYYCTRLHDCYDQILDDCENFIPLEETDDGSE
jgi:hypothetical protein